jgi:hypothetical protein
MSLFGELVRPSHMAACPSRTPLLRSAPGLLRRQGRVEGPRSEPRPARTGVALSPDRATGRSQGAISTWIDLNSSFSKLVLDSPKAGRVVRTWRRNRPVRGWVQGPRRGARTREVDPDLLRQAHHSSPFSFSPCPCWEGQAPGSARRGRGRAGGCGRPGCPVVGGEDGRAAAARRRRLNP